MRHLRTRNESEARSRKRWRCARSALLFRISRIELRRRAGLLALAAGVCLLAGCRREESAAPSQVPRTVQLIVEDTPSAFFEKIAPAEGGEPGTIEMSVTFQGGARACVAAQGNHRPVVPLELAVYDDKNQLIVQDKGEHDHVAAFWVPPRTAEHRVVLRNHGTELGEQHRVYIIIK